MKIKAIIVDDEPLAIEVIESYLKAFSDIEIIGKCGDGIQAFQLLQQKKVDLMFLDIKMPKINGNDLLKSLKNPPKVIFTTAYDDYAVEGFELNALDYLLKPIPFERFLKAMDKVYEHYGFSKQQSVQTENQNLRSHNLFLYLKVDRKTVKVDVNEILWVESQKDYIKVILNDRTLISKQKISIVEELLPEDGFLRIHRSFIIALNKVKSFSSSIVEIENKELPIGRNYKNECQRRLKAF